MVKKLIAEFDMLMLRIARNSINRIACEKSARGEFFRACVREWVKEWENKIKQEAA